MLPYVCQVSVVFLYSYIWKPFRFAAMTKFSNTSFTCVSAKSFILILFIVRPLPFRIFWLSGKRSGISRQWKRTVEISTVLSLGAVEQTWAPLLTQVRRSWLPFRSPATRGLLEHPPDILAYGHAQWVQVCPFAETKNETLIRSRFSLGAVEQTWTAEPLPYQGSALPTELQQQNGSFVFIGKTSINFIINSPNMQEVFS